jgi:hypothetical protein
MQVNPMTDIAQTPFARLEAEQRLLNPVHKGPIKKAGRFGFRGDLALEFAVKLADEARPPKIKVDQVLSAANPGSATIDFFAAYLLSFEYLKLVGDVLGNLLSPTGKYFLFCSNLNLNEHYVVPYNGITFIVLPIDEAGVFNELLDLIHLDRGDVKRLDGAGKIDAIADKAATFTPTFPSITYEEGLKRMTAVRNPNENRPV